MVLGRILPVFFGVLVVTSAWSAEPDTRQGAASSRPSTDQPLPVIVELGPGDPDAGAIRDAIGAELRVAVAESASPDRREKVTVRRVSEEVVEVTYEPEGGGKVTRSVTSPEAPDRLVLVIALLTGNLVRAEANELLADIEARKQANATGAPLPHDASAPADATGATASAAAASAVPATASDAKQNPGKRKEARTKPESPIESKKKFRHLNASFLHPVAIPDSEDYVVGLELGLLYGYVGGVRGLALSAVATRVEGDVEGVTLTGLGAVVSGKVVGVQAAGFGVITGDVAGAQATGFGTISGDLSGVQASGFGNMSRRMSGVQLAGFGNVARGGAEGLQVAAATNVATDRSAGVQIAGGANVAADDFEGVQLGVVNVGARKVSGFQVGVVNVAGELDGFSLALATIASNVRAQAVAWWSSTLASNVGAKFTNGLVTTQTSFGYEPEGDRHRIAAGLSVGLHQGLAGPLFVDADTGYYSENVLAENVSEHEQVLRTRAMLGWSVLDRLDVIAGGGVRTRLPGASREAKHDPEFFAGIQAF